MRDGNSIQAKKTILVADDSPGGRELLRAILERDGRTVIEAADGAEALGMLNQYVPDLVILDIHMPKLDGFEVLAALREDARFTTTPILALTASASPGDRERILGAGFSRHQTKPIGPARLRQTVAEMLDGVGEGAKG
jgi:CheY-like chemotaxis protein